MWGGDAASPTGAVQAKRSVQRTPAISATAASAAAPTTAAPPANLRGRARELPLPTPPRLRAAAGAQANAAPAPHLPASASAPAGAPPTPFAAASTPMVTRSVTPALLQRAYGGAPLPTVVQREPADDSNADNAAPDPNRDDADASGETVDLRTLAQQVLPYLKTLMQVERERYGRSRWR